MSYYESAEGELITRKRAYKELRDHGCSEEDYNLFYEEVLPNPEGLYDAQAVLRWLGY